MTLAHTYADAQLNHTLELFVRLALDLLHDSLLCVLTHGSLVLDDFAPGYSDLDFVAVVADDDLAAETREQLIEQRKPLRSGTHGPLAAVLEGPFLPRRMLDPQVAGQALCWGTGGERLWERNKLGALATRVIRERGQVIYGPDLREEFSSYSRQEGIAEVRTFCVGALTQATPGTLKSVDWLLTAARLLLWVREDQLSSKSRAADWGHAHAVGEWRTLLPQAKQLRLRPALAQREEWRTWLAQLGEPTHEAAREVLAQLPAECK